MVTCHVCGEEWDTTYCAGCGTRLVEESIQEQLIDHMESTMKGFYTEIEKLCGYVEEEVTLERKEKYQHWITNREKALVKWRKWKAWVERQSNP